MIIYLNFLLISCLAADMSQETSEVPDPRDGVEEAEEIASVAASTGTRVPEFRDRQVALDSSSTPRKIWLRQIHAVNPCQFSDRTELRHGEKSR